MGVMNSGTAYKRRRNGSVFSARRTRRESPCSLRRGLFVSIRNLQGSALYHREESF